MNETTPDNGDLRNPSLLQGGLSVATGQPAVSVATAQPGEAAPTAQSPESTDSTGAALQRAGLPGDLFGRVWAVWVIGIFVVTMLLFLIPFLLFCYFLPDPKKTSRFTRFSRVWMGVFLPLAGCPLRIKGKEKFSKGQTYIVVCNHNALLDVPITSPGIPGGNKTIAKTDFAKIPVFGLMYRTGSILVDRKSEISRRESFSKMKETLEKGLHMCLYPEGTRNKTRDPLKSFHDGAFRLAIVTGKPIIPAVIFNTKKIMPPEKGFFFMPHRLYMDFLDPVIPLEEETVENLKKRVFTLMWDYYTAHSSR
jgi:1-acyl-sn-glycerol-3-phosphate acyltransferase